jgi:uncharacterized protein YdeI (YjbR/CyaY-like superfamily)
VRPSNVTFFESSADFRGWLEKHAATAQELWVGYHKKGSGKASITWPESVDEALCVGWIDGIRKSLDEDRYTIRFTPRRAGSTWSAVNIGRVAELEKGRRMRAAGRRAFEKRKEDRSGRYSYEQRRSVKLAPGYEKKLKAVPKAWKFFRSQAPWYQWTLSWWVMSAKQEATRMRRLDRLIAESAREQRIGPTRRAKK